MPLKRISCPLTAKERFSRPRGPMMYLARFTRNCSAAQEDFVHEMIANDQLKAAVATVNDLGLQESFPDLERQYRAAVVAQLLAKGRWAVATRFAAEDTDLQKQARHFDCLAKVPVVCAFSRSQRRQCAGRVGDGKQWGLVGGAGVCSALSPGRGVARLQRSDASRRGLPVRSRAPVLPPARTCTSVAALSRRLLQFTRSE